MPPDIELMKRIDILITDMRASKWESVPVADRKQIDVPLKGVCIYGIKAYENLKAQIKKEFQISSDFIFCPPDQNADINKTNISRLRNDDRLFIVDFLKQDIPFHFEQVINTTPHTNTITDQGGTYHANKDQNAAAFALADLVDNSLSATSHMKDKRTIEIRFYDNGANSSLHILDNGCGMNSDVLKSGLKYKAPKESRRFDNRNFSNDPNRLSQINDPGDEIHPMYINSNISKFGAGMKQAVFFLGENVRIFTKGSDCQNVSEVFYSKRDLDRMENSEEEDPWKLKVYMGRPGEVRFHGKEDEKLIKCLLAEEIGKPSFTHIVITRIHDDKRKVSRLELLRQVDVSTISIERQLAHIYHYYIHGRNCWDVDEDSISSRPNGLVDLIVTRYTGEANRLMSRYNLRDLSNIAENLEHQFIRSSAEDFNFLIEISQYSEVGGSFKVGGVIRYHPYKYDHETHPGGILTRKSKSGSENTSDELDEEVDGQLSTEGNGNDGAAVEMENNDEYFDTPRDEISIKQSTTISAMTSRRKCSDFFQIWWNGRLIPNARWESFDWCSPSARFRTNDPILKCYDRVSGSLFLDSNIDAITCTKLEMTAKNQFFDMFKEKKIGGQQATFLRIETMANGVPKASRMQKSSKSFEAWIRNCHKKYDKQVIYSICTGTQAMRIENISKRDYDIYEKAVWDITLKTGDAVKLIGSRGVSKTIGRVLSFLVESGGDSVISNGSVTHAPLAYVEIQQLPEALFTGKEEFIIYKSMSYIDKTVKSADVELIISEREKDLDMKLVLKEWTGGQLVEGDIVSMDSQLIKGLRINIVKKFDGNVVPGLLFHPAGDKTAKKIFLFARVFHVDDNGERELYYTSNQCKYDTKYKGYYFKNIDLKVMNIVEPGNYVVTFISYVDLIDPPEQSKSKSSNNSSSYRSTLACTSSASDNQRVESAEDRLDIDDVGRHTLRCGNRRIPMPFHEGINFKIVAGQPSKFYIEDINGEDCDIKIGQPFEVRLSFQDNKGNVTPPLCENSSLLPLDKNLLTVIPNRKLPEMSLEFTYSMPYLRNNFVIIPNVVASGLISGDGRACKMTANMQLKKLVSSPPLAFRVFTGNPHQLKVVEKRINVENGTYAKLTCLVLDSSQNLVIKSFVGNKPILLTCDIYNGKDMESGKLFEGLTLLSATDENNCQIILDKTINLEELKTGQIDEIILLCKIRYEEFKIETNVLLYVHPSKRPEKIFIFYRNSYCMITEIYQDSHLYRKVNEHIGDLTFKVIDGMGNIVEFNPDKYKFEFDWPSDNQIQIADTSFDFGELPKLEIPNKTFKNKEVKTRFISLSTNDENTFKLTHNFFLTTTPLEASELRVTGSKHSLGERIELRIDEAHSEDIILTLVDEYGNTITDAGEEFTTHDITVELAETREFDFTFERLACKDLDEMIAGTFVVRQLKFTTPPPLGDRDLEIWVGPLLSTILKIKLVPGKPVGLSFEIDNDIIPKNNAIVSLPNLSTPRIRVRLIDSCRNTVTDIRRCFISLEKHRKMVTETISRVMTNMEGIADFKLLIIGMQPQEITKPCRVKESPCINKCFNLNYLTANAELEGSSIAEARVNFHILSRTDVPTNLSIDSGHLGSFVYRAGCTFEGLTATLETEDDSTFINTCVDDLVMCLYNVSTNSVFSISPTYVQDGVFSFGGVPEKAGCYLVKFLFDNGNTRFEQTPCINIRIIGSSITYFEVEDSEEIDNIFISNDSNDRQRRSVAIGLKLVLKDEYKNVVTEYLTLEELEEITDEINGSVEILLMDSLFSILPIFFENPEELFKPIPLKDGVAVIPDIVLQPETNLKNNSKYIINFTASLRSGKVYVYTLKFTFFNDVARQHELQELEKEKTALSSKIKTLKDNYEIYEVELQKLKTAESKLKHIEETQRLKINGNSPTKTLKDIITYENNLTPRRKKIEGKRRITECNVEKFQVPESEENMILGPGGIGHLAQIKPEKTSTDIKSTIAIQKILSWHLQSFLPVIVARDMAQGMELSKKYFPKQFLLSDIMYMNDASNWTEKIPIKLKRFGNPIFIYDLLYLTSTNPTDIELSRKVFDNILGRTILVNTLPDAIQFMKNYNKIFTHKCPTILTRDGHRLTSSVIVGGTENETRAPPSINDLKYKFGITQSEELKSYDMQFKHLAVLKTRVNETMKATSAIEMYINKQKETVCNIQKELIDCQEKEKKVFEALNMLKNEQIPESSRKSVNNFNSTLDSSTMKLHMPAISLTRCNLPRTRSSIRIKNSHTPAEPQSQDETSSKRARRS